MNGAQTTVRALRQEGVRYVFGLPGTTVMELIDALGDEDEIRYIVVRHEQVAAFMADGYARASGELAVCMASRGPGAANLAIGIHNAHAESVPVLALVGQVPDSVAYRDSFEEMDLLTFFQPMTKWQVEIHDAARIPELVQRACRTAVSGRPGGVLVSLPHDIQIDVVDAPTFQTRWRSAASSPDSGDVDNAARLLADARRPAIIVGGGVPSHSSAIIALAAALSAPVVTTWLRKSHYPNDEPTYLGGLGYGSLPATQEAVGEADVILALGTKFSEFSTNRWSLISPRARLIHVDLDEREVGKIYAPTVGVIADAERTAQQLMEALAGLPAGGYGQSRAGRLVQLRTAYLHQGRVPEQESAPGTVSSQAILDALQPLMLEPDTVLVADAPGFGTWIHRYLSFPHPRSFYGAAGGSMGWGLPAAMGIQLARPESRTIVVAGDGSFWMVAQDLETAVRENIPVVVVVNNNFSFGNTRDRQRFSFGQRYNGVFYSNPDFAAFAELLGAHGTRVEKAEELTPALRTALECGRPALIDVIQDPMEGLPLDLVPPGVPGRP